MLAKLGIYCNLVVETRAASIAPAVLSLVRAHTEKAAPPRALYCDFPFGRPLGRPGDPSFQRGVMEKMFALLAEQGRPVHVDYATAIPDQWGTPTDINLSVPPSALHPALAEIAVLRELFERWPGDGWAEPLPLPWDGHMIQEAISGFIGIAMGIPWEKTGLPAHPTDSALAIRCYAEAAVLQSLAGIPPARSVARWFYERSQAGRSSWRRNVRWWLREPAGMIGSISPPMSTACP